MSKESVSQSGVRTITFVFLLSIIIVETVSLRKPYTRSICSFFPLCTEWNNMEEYMYGSICQVGRGFANGSRNRCSIPKMLFDASLLNTQHYKVRIKDKWSNPGKGVAPSFIPRCSSYQKGSLRVTLEYGCQLYLYMCVRVCVCG